MNGIWDILSLVYMIFSYVMSLITEESLLYMTIGYAILSIIILLIAIKYINKNEGIMNSDLMSKNY